MASTNVERFLQIASDAGVIYRKHGAVDSVTVRVTDATAKYGCLGLTDVVSNLPNEELFLGIDSFHSAEQFHSAMVQIDADPQINQLYQDIQKVVDFHRVIRWEADGPA